MYVEDPRKIAIEEREGRLTVLCPFLYGAKEELKKAGGRWAGAGWQFASTARPVVEKVLRRWFGTAGEAVDRGDVQISAPKDVLQQWAHYFGADDLTGRYGYPGASCEIHSDHAVWTLPSLPTVLLQAFEARLEVEVAAREKAAALQAEHLELASDESSAAADRWRCRHCRAWAFYRGMRWTVTHAWRECPEVAQKVQPLVEDPLLDAVAAARKGLPSVFEVKVLRAWPVEAQEQALEERRRQRLAGRAERVREHLRHRAAEGFALEAQVSVLEGVLARVALEDDLGKNLAALRAALTPEELACLQGLEQLAAEERTLRDRVTAFLAPAAPAPRAASRPLADPLALLLMLLLPSCDGASAASGLVAGLLLGMTLGAWGLLRWLATTPRAVFPLRDRHLWYWAQRCDADAHTERRRWWWQALLDARRLAAGKEVR